MSTEPATNKRRVTPADIIVARRIRSRRKMLELTQQQVGDALNVTVQQYQKYEMGQNRIPFTRLLQLAAALNTTIWEFLADLPLDLPEPLQPTVPVQLVIPELTED